MGRNGGSGAGRGARSRSGQDGFRPGTRFMSGAELASVTFNDAPITPTSEARLEEVRRLFRSGRADESRVALTAHRDGRVNVDDGRHRLLVSREPEFKHIKLKVEISRGAGGRKRKKKAT